jgi:glycosyltransferase involved in cell wall biosynthesis
MGPIKNGGVGTASFYLAKFIAKKFGSANILYASPMFHSTPELKNKWTDFYGIHNINLLPLKLSKHFIDHGFSFSTLAYLVYQNLKDSFYDIIIFPEMHGMGHYCFWAKKTGMSFLNTKLVVMYHGPTEWHHKFNHSNPRDINEMILYNTEKQSTQLCEHIFFATQYSKKSAIRLGYLTQNLNNKSKVILYPFKNISQNSIKKKYKINEICFFGRIETRKGISTFLEAIIECREEIKNKKIAITLLGKINYSDGKFYPEILKKWSENNNIKINLITNFDHSEAISYLKNRRCLAVLASTEETMGYTLIECITNNIPFVCTDIAPYIEILNKFKIKKPNIFIKGSAIDLGRQLKTQLSKIERPKKYLNIIERLEKKWTNSLEQIAVKKNLCKPKRNHAPKPLSICIVHRNRSSYLNQLLKSLGPLTKIIGEIIIFDNHSTNFQDIKYLKKIQNKNKVKVFFGVKNHGPSFARNRLAEISSFENLLFIDDDNLLDAKIFFKLYSFLSQKSDWDLVVSPLKKFNEDKFLTEYIGKYLPNSFDELESLVKSEWLPVFLDFNLNLYVNVAGDANFLIKKKQFLKVGGFNEDIKIAEDQLFFLKSHLNNSKYFLCPEAFVYYRISPKKVNQKSKDINVKIRDLVMKKLAEDLKTPQIEEYFKINSSFFINKSAGTSNFELGGLQKMLNWRSFINFADDMFFVSEITTNKTKIFQGNLEVNLKSNKKNMSSISQKYLNKRMIVRLFVFSQNSESIRINSQKITIPKGGTTVVLNVINSSKFKLSFKSKNMNKLKIKSCTIDSINILNDKE